MCRPRLPFQPLGVHPHCRSPNRFEVVLSANVLKIAALAALLAACASPRVTQPPVLEPVPAEPLPLPEPLDQRESVQPVPVPDAYASAIERGTRTVDGAPGARYWQQRVDYRIDAELDPETAVLQGDETITYHNNSPDTLRSLVLHLYQNTFRQGGARSRTSGVTLERVQVGTRTAARVVSGTDPVPGVPSYDVDGTLMELQLGRALAPGASTRINIAWRFPVPESPAPRMGRVGHSVYNIAQWYPQVAVYDDVHGWHRDPYLGAGEFYLEYGNFDVALTVPEGWLVGATGLLQNPEEVLSDSTQARLARAARSRSVVHIATADDHEARTVTVQDPGGSLTWRFRARDVRDFAFATAREYLYDAVNAVVPDADGDGDAENVLVHAYYRDAAVRWRAAADYTRDALEFMAARFGTYIYPQLSVAEGPVGGMEYPMMMFIAPFTTEHSLYTTIAHEVAHQWYPMMVGSNEPAHAWMDEGTASYIENLAMEAQFPETDAADEMLGTYLSIAGGQLEEPLITHADAFRTEPGFVIGAYSKPGAMLGVLAGIIGEETLQRALQAYTRRWLLRHPHPLDFFATVEDVAGQDLDWFWHPWWYTTATYDPAVTGVQISPAGPGEQIRVTIEDQGSAPLPTPIVVTMQDGKVRQVTVPVEVWLRGVRTHTEIIDLPSPVEKVEIDPERRMPDTDRTDNIWRRSR